MGSWKSPGKFFVSKGVGTMSFGFDLVAVNVVSVVQVFSSCDFYTSQRHNSVRLPVKQCRTLCDISALATIHFWNECIS